MSRLSNSTTRALREPLPVLTLALTRHVGCTAGIYRRLWPLQMTPVRTTNGAMPTSSRARQRRRGSSAKPGAIADIDPRPRLPAETRSDGARSEVRAGDAGSGRQRCGRGSHEYLGHLFCEVMFITVTAQLRAIRRVWHCRSRRTLDKRGSAQTACRCPLGLCSPCPWRPAGME